MGLARVRRDTFKERRERNAQTGSNARQRQSTGIAHACFDLSNETAVHVDAQRQGLLRQTTLATKVLEATAKGNE